MLHRIAVLSLLLAATACGDNNPGTVDASGHIDAGSGADAAPDAPAALRAMIAAGDFTAGDPGVLAKLDLAPLAVTEGLATAGAIGDNPVVRHFGHELFVVNSADGDNVTILDDTAFTVDEQIATGSGSNPQDVARVGDKLYVPTLVGKGVVVLTRGTSTSKTIDLSADDPDGNPNCQSAIAVGSDVYVSCGLLNDTTFEPRAVGEVYVIDSATDTLRTKFALTTKNPITLFEQIGDGDIAIGTVLFDDFSGCIETIATGTTPKSTCAVTNTVLVGFPARIQFPTATTMALALNAPTFTTPVPQSLVTYDLTAKTLNVLSPATEHIGDVGLCPDGTLVVSDVTSGAAGMRAYRAGVEVTTSALPIGLPPSASHGIECY